MSNQNPKNEISESQLSWIFLIIFLQRYWSILILVPILDCGVYILVLPLLGKLISIILGIAFSAIAYAVILPKSYLKTLGNMNCINNFAKDVPTSTNPTLSLTNTISLRKLVF